MRDIENLKSVGNTCNNNGDSSSYDSSYDYSVSVVLESSAKPSLARGIVIIVACI